MSSLPEISKELPLYKSLVALEYDEEDVYDVLGNPLITAEILRCSVDSIPDFLRDKLVSQLVALAEDTAPGNPEAEAVFSYGSLRGDYSPSGDRWGVVSKTEAQWVKASVKGFRLYQDPRLGYPFVVHTGVATDIVWGTLLTWTQGREAARSAIAECDCLEGFRENQPSNGLYCRMVTDVLVSPMPGVNEKTPPSVVPALIYHQEWPQETLKLVQNFPSGDWLRGRTNRTSLTLLRQVLNRILCGICG